MVEVEVWQAATRLRLAGCDVKFEESWEANPLIDRQQKQTTLSTTKKLSKNMRLGGSRIQSPAQPSSSGLFAPGEPKEKKVIFKKKGKRKVIVSGDKAEIHVQ
ncbi:predicted protein [Histoplasma capsulatum var. duboisii H88]|uniref:Predicted protein n=1 Tax=Ajellomyces capsulatus (strain H88) TaxID=544711 RepID=F0UGF8_AJEC8|nr:predicted protein [Histoplasma capsulatum var. duboisii H88]